MERIKKCRICMGNIIPLRSIVNTHLQEMYELLTLMPLETEDNRPTLVCYICCARLQNCYQLRSSCIQSEQLFTQIMDNNVFEKESSGKNSFTIAHPVVHLSMGNKLENSTISLISDDSESSEEFDRKTVKEENGQKEEDSDSDENSIDPSTECINTNDLLDIEKNELDDGSTKEEDSDSDDDPNTQYTNTNDLLDIEKNELDDGSTKEEDSDSDDDPNTQYTNINDLLDIEKNELDDDSTSAPVHKKLRVALQRNLEDITKRIDNKFNNATDEIEQSKTDTEIVARRKIVIKSDYIIPTKDKNTSSECLSTSEHNDIQMESLSINISRDTSVSNASRKNLHTVRCDICQKRFSYKSDLIRHIRKHTGEKPFKCKLCEKCYTREGNLNIHIRTHAGEKRLKCKFCEKRFSQKCNLKTHIRIHTGEKPFKCKFCEKCFSCKSNCNSHIRTHTGKKLIKCWLCKKNFSTKSILNAHIRKHTGAKVQ